MHGIRRFALPRRSTSGLGLAARAAKAAASVWLDRLRSRRRLAALDPRELADIGRTEPERWRECAKWFWQA